MYYIGVAYGVNPYMINIYILGYVLSTKSIIFVGMCNWLYAVMKEIKELEAKRADLDKEIEGYLKELGLVE